MSKIVFGEIHNEPAAGSAAPCLGSPVPQTVRDAARKLSSRRPHLPGQEAAIERKWTGFVFERKRAWVGMPVVLPEGTVGWVKRAQMGVVCLRTSVVDPIDGPVHDYLWATALKPYRLPEAVLLGSLKRGKREKVSMLKAASSRRNGLMPVKAGNRRRGRPRKIEGGQQSAQVCAPLVNGGRVLPPWKHGSQAWSRRGRRPHKSDRLAD